MLTFLEPKGNRSLIIFVHGFAGGKETWIRNDHKTSILGYLKEDVTISSKFDFAIFDYFSTITNLSAKAKWWFNFILRGKTKFKKNIPIEDVAHLLQSEIKIKCDTYTSIVLIAHSMGGLVSKSYLLEELKNSRKIPIKLFISLAVPHRGTDFATYAKLIVGNQQVLNLRPLADIVNKMNDEWIKFPDQVPETLYFQAKNDQIVSYISTVSSEIREIQVVYSDDDHFSIVCPDKEESVVITAIKKSCLKLVDQSKTIPTSTGNFSVNNLVGTWKNEFTISGEVHSEVAYITEKGHYLINNEHRFNIEDFSYEEKNKEIKFLKVSVKPASNTKFYNSLTVENEELLIGTENGNNISYTKISNSK